MIEFGQRLSTDFAETPDSPFHLGEQFVQYQLGVRDKMEQFGRRVIRDYMPDQHRQFYKKLPFVLIGHVDESGWPWASILCGGSDLEQSFMLSPNERQLDLHATPFTGDPLNRSLKRNSRVGLLGIEMQTRRRNRLSATVESSTETKTVLRVDQAFGNCPQYIQNRGVLARQNPLPITVEAFTTFDKTAEELIMGADTFFVSSYAAFDSSKSADSANESAWGADVSHRGGQPGFVLLQGNKLTIPDFPGNNHFNTLGNFVANPKAGLLFVDFDQGHLLMITGTVEVHWLRDLKPTFTNAERFWSFNLDHGVWIKNALPFRFQFEAYSPNSLLSGTWHQAEDLQKMEEKKDFWHEAEVTEIIQESETVKSFYLKPSGGLVPAFLPGQFLSLRKDLKNKNMTRTYTVSNAPSENIYRISVKKEGVFSHYLHEELKSGDIVEYKPPRGSFVFDSRSRVPAILIAAGIGVTPMVSMLRHSLMESIRVRQARPIVLVYCVRNWRTAPFKSELLSLQNQSKGLINVLWVVTQPEPNLKRGIDFHYQGRFSKPILGDLINTIVKSDQADYYLCGPGEFMQTVYDLLRDEKIVDGRIHAETFGPSALVISAQEEDNGVPVADSALVTVSSDSGIILTEQLWNKDQGTLLEFLESHGIEPEYACRSGQCGTCEAKLLAGQVRHRVNSANMDSEHLLLCSASPAAVEDDSLNHVHIELP